MLGNNGGKNKKYLLRNEAEHFNLKKANYTERVGRKATGLRSE